MNRRLGSRIGLGSEAPSEPHVGLAQGNSRWEDWESAG